MLPLLALALLAPQEPSPGVESIAWFSAEQVGRAEQAAAHGLRWLAGQQQASGSWTGLVGHKMQDDYVEIDQGLPLALQLRREEGHLGVTSLCAMAFLAGGHLPDRGEHHDVVARALTFVVEHAAENGFLSSAGTRMYSHAFATLFLAEVHGMAAAPRAKEALERAVNLIVDSQNGHGGWRYNPFDRETDLSVTVCQLQALRAARNIGIRVPSETIDRAMRYVEQSRVRDGRAAGLYYYKIHGRGSYSKPREYAINAAALTALSSAGILDAERADPVLDFLDAEYEAVCASYGTHYYFWYGNYYAAQAFYQHGGERLRAFYARLVRDLLHGQQADGRFFNRVGPGDEFSTAMACILLQMPKQYLPIFQR